jgi:membrane dipeptidase
MRFMNKLMAFFGLAVLLGSCATVKPVSDDALKARAQEYSQQFILIDTHVDVPYRLRDQMEDISRETPGGNFDFPRAKRGGLNAPFMSIYVPSAYEKSGGAKLLADTLIDMVRKIAADHADKFAMASSVADVTAQFKEGKLSFCMGMENGSPIEHDLANVVYFYKRGIRYITLTHAKDNHISDSSYDTTRTNHGLSAFGKKVVSEMNRVGIMVDVSHISDDAFYDVMKESKAPVIASHSSCRYFTPGWERNMSDGMIRLLASNGGVIMINFGSSFIRNDYRLKDSVARAEIQRYIDTQHWSDEHVLAKAYEKKYREEHPIAHATIAEVARHIDHVVKLVGSDHVGLGSDFDGVGDSLPVGLQDVSQYPNVIYELLKLGYSKKDIEKICGLNLLRVWTKVEKTAKEMQNH